jgi:release factor H-coupled RctB family protein
MGEIIKHLTAGAVLIASDATWIEGSALQQLQNTLKLPGMRRVAGMPDLHPGQGYPVGAAFFSVGHFYPALIGNDIGCGMSLWRTSLDKAKNTTDRLEKRLGSIDGPLDARWQEAIAEFNLPTTGFEASLGTLGGGNHFAEIQQIEEIYDREALTQLEIDPRQLLLLVHSGSRGLGEKILRQQIDRHSHHGLTEGSDEALAYEAEHEIALRFAQANRQLIAWRILDRLRGEGVALLDVPHNWLTAAEIDGQKGWLHRKGASPADAGIAVIPGSRGDYSYLVQPLPNPQSLFSIAHGAGRKWMRSECKARLSARYRQDQLLKTPLGNRVVCQDKDLLFEEAPEAYKRIDQVIASLVDSGLMLLIARLRPVLTYKTAKAESS